MSRPVLDLELVKAFVAVAESRSFTRAAGVLNRTQSAVSMQVRKLEDRLGIGLLHRTTVSVALSPAGESFLGYARRLLALNDEAIGRLLAHSMEGHIRIGAMEDYATFVLPEMLAAFVAGHPNVHLEMETGLTHAMPERLGDDFDLVIAMHSEGCGDGELLRREQAIWAAGASHEVETQEPLPVALHPQGCLFRRWAMDALDAQKRPWRLAFVSQSLAAVEAIAAQGLAVTVAKAGTFPSRLRAVGENGGMPRLPVAEIRLHRARGLSPAGSLLAEHLVTAMRSP